MQLTVVFLAYFLLILLILPLLHWTIKRFDLHGWVMWLSVYAWGTVCWWSLRYVVGADLARNMMKSIPVAFLVVLAAVFLYDYVQQRWW